MRIGEVLKIVRRESPNNTKDNLEIFYNLLTNLMPLNKLTNFLKMCELVKNVLYLFSNQSCGHLPKYSIHRPITQPQILSSNFLLERK